MLKTYIGKSRYTLTMQKLTVIINSLVKLGDGIASNFITPALTKVHIVPLEQEAVMSTPTYDPFGTEATYKSKLFVCQMGHKQKWT